MKKKQLRKSEIRDLRQAIENNYAHSIEFSKNDKVEVVDDSIVVVNGEQKFFYHEDYLVPTLRACQKECFLKKVTVDMGAVKFVTGGADVMRPGIVKLEEGISKDDLVAVVDENNSVPLAICSAMFDGNDIMDMKQGKVLKSIHYVGDELWARIIF